MIPTTGRPELARAVQSALSQTGIGRIEVIVVDDSPNQAATLSLSTESVRVLRTQGGRGASAARNLGVASATMPWLAFLDDDDSFLPTKLSAQLAVALEMRGGTGVEPVVSCQVVQSSGDSQGEPIPKQVYRGGPVDSFLFRRRRPGAGRASAYTSTLLCSTELAQANLWDEDLARHTDWDWLIRICSLDQVSLTQLDQTLVRIQPNSRGSISASSDWKASLGWSTRVLRNRDPNVFVDFVAGQPLRYAISARSLRGVRACLAQILHARRVPAVGPLLIGLSGIVSRHRLEKLMRLLH